MRSERPLRTDHFGQTTSDRLTDHFGQTTIRTYRMSYVATVPYRTSVSVLFLEQPI